MGFHGSNSYQICILAPTYQMAGRLKAPIVSKIKGRRKRKNKKRWGGRGTRMRDEDGEQWRGTGKLCNPLLLSPHKTEMGWISTMKVGMKSLHFLDFTCYAVTVNTCVSNHLCLKNSASVGAKRIGPAKHIWHHNTLGRAISEMRIYIYVHHHSSVLLNS